MAMFGKALGNGYAITGTIGRREVMEAAQSHLHQQHVLDGAHRPDGRASRHSKSWSG